MPIESLKPAALLMLAQWFSPAYPLGSFAYSHGLEWAVQAGDVVDAATLESWVSSVLEHGSGRTDAIFLAAAFRADTPEALAELNELAAAMAPSKERLLETTQQGAAFAKTTRMIWHNDVPDMAFPLAVGHAAQLKDLPLTPTLQFYLHAFASNLISAGVRLIPLGQTEGQAGLSRLAPVCQAVAEGAENSTLDDLGSSTVMIDIASMKHETQYTRLFRS